MSTDSTPRKGDDEKKEAAKKPGKDDVHEQREPDQDAEGVVEDTPAEKR